MSPDRKLESSSTHLFQELRRVAGAAVSVRFEIGTHGTARVDIPASVFCLQGTLTVQPNVDRFGLQVRGWGPEDFAWFARRKGLGGLDYWQGAVEYRPEGRPALVLYFTAPLGGLEITVHADAPA